MSRLDGGPAFPGVWRKTDDGFERYDDPGMSLRDWFAGMAMNGIIAACSKDGDCDYIDDNVVIVAFAMADVMLRERKK